MNINNFNGLTRLPGAVTSSSVDEEINPDKVYFIRPKGQNPVGQYYGRDWIKNSKIKKRKSNGKSFYSWVDFLNSGTLQSPGQMYEMVTAIQGEETLIMVYAGRASYPKDETGMNDDISKPNLVIPPPTNQIHERTNIRMLADTLVNQNNVHISTLSDELERKDNFINQLNTDANVLYERANQRERDFLAEKEVLIKANLDLQKEIEKLKREHEIEKIRFELMNISREERTKLERKLEKLENSKKFDFNKTLQGLANSQVGLGILSKFMGGGELPAMAPLADVPNYDMDDDDDDDSGGSND